MPSGNILELPVETLNMICATMCAHCSEEDWSPEHFYGSSNRELANLSATCRTLRTIAQPFLYHDIHAQSALLLLRTVIARPELGALVRGLSLQPQPVDSELLSGEHVQLLSSVERRLGLEPPSEGWQELDEYDRGDWVWDYLLAHLPGLEALGVMVGPGSIGEYLRGKVKRGSLLRVYMVDQHFNDSFSLESGEHLVAMAPRLKSLSLHLCCDVPENLSLGALRSLSLTQAHMSLEDLATIIQACPQLERFEYEPSLNLWESTDYDFEVISGELQNILRPRKDALTHLYFYFHEGSLNSSDSESEADGYFSFEDFPRLETLMLDPEAFGLSNFAKLPHSIPPSLVTLGFVDESRISRVQEAATAVAILVKDGHFPKLREILADCEADTLESVQSMLVDSGVALKPYSSRVTKRWI